MALLGCGSADVSQKPGGLGTGGSGVGAAGAGATAGSGTSGDGGAIITMGGSGGSGAAGAGGSTGNTCATQHATAELLPVRLAFAFDVSGSMGKLDFPWHDPTLKWDPVVAATRAFFEDPTSSGLEASLTVFPTASSRCEDASYLTPIVPMTALPSPTFGAALDAIRAEPWRGGTPTLHVVNGVLSFIATSSSMSRARYVLVLVTDGYPQGCSDNEIASVANAVAAVSSSTPTYVIGIANPPLVDANGNMAPETVMNLNAIADAGRGQAFMIDTGNPAQTSAAFAAAVNQIRGVTISCNVDIPPIPGGQMFERDKVLVTHTSGGTVTELTYDPTCAAPNAWHYDDPLAPSQIVLCDTTCAAVKADAASVLDVTFTCNTVIDPR